MRIGLLFQLALVLAACGLAKSAYAVEDTPKDGVHKVGEKTTGKADHKEEEKDKTAFMGIKRYDLAIYTLIIFGLLFLVLGKYAWKPIMDGLQKREDMILQARTDAEKSREEAQKLLIEVKAQRAKATEEVAAMLSEARKDADVFREAEKSRTAADVQADRERLKREIETARDQALQEIWSKTVELAALMSTKVVRREIKIEDHGRLIDEALADLKLNVTKA